MPKKRLFNLKNLGIWAGIKKKKKKNNGEAEVVDKECRGPALAFIGRHWLAWRWWYAWLRVETPYLLYIACDTAHFNQ
jgi:hypothetical protein